MAQTTLNISMDEKVKEQFDSFCDEIGLDAASTINLFVKTVLREERIPFEISLHNHNLDDPFYSEENQNKLLLSAEQMERSGGTVHELIEDYND